MLDRTARLDHSQPEVRVQGQKSPQVERRMASVPIARHAFAHKADSQDKKRRSALHPLALRGEPLDAKRGKRTRACPGPTKEYGRWRAPQLFPYTGTMAPRVTR